MSTYEQSAIIMNQPFPLWKQMFKVMKQARQASTTQKKQQQQKQKTVTVQLYQACNHQSITKH